MDAGLSLSMSWRERKSAESQANSCHFDDVRGKYEQETKQQPSIFIPKQELPWPSDQGRQHDDDHDDLATAALKSPKSRHILSTSVSSPTAVACSPTSHPSQTCSTSNDWPRTKSHMENPPTTASPRSRIRHHPSRICSRAHHCTSPSLTRC